MNTLPTLLLVDDDPEIREQMKWALASDYELLEASDRPSALRSVRQAMPHIILLDLGLPPDTDGASEGLAVLREALQINPLIKVIVLTGNSDRANAIAAIQSGGYDFIEKPVQLDVLKIVLQRAAYLSNLEQENRSFQQQAGLKEAVGLMGNSRPMQEVFRIDHRREWHGQRVGCPCDSRSERANQRSVCRDKLRRDSGHSPRE
jgi:two-component system NtrC family response regulator